MKQVIITIGCGAFLWCMTGCSGDLLPPPEPVEGDVDGDVDGDTDTDADSDTTAPSKDAWVNITTVSVTGSEGAYRFNITFESSDVDCSRYADWLEVVKADGTLLYRRILLHPHTKDLTGNPVTRGGGPVAMSADETVIVRGHMNEAGYVGIAMKGSVNGGFEQDTSIDDTFAPNVEGEAPQPGDCISEADMMGK